MGKTELDHITDFINSPAFAMMSEEVKSETYSKQKELAIRLIEDKIAEVINPVISKYSLDVAVKVLPIKKREEALSQTSKPKIEEPVVTTKKESVVATKKEPVVSNKTTKTPATGLCVWLRDGKFIQEYSAADTMIKAIQTVGCARVKALGLTLDKENIILPHGNYPTPMAPHAAGNGFYVNTHCNTAAKKRILEKISNALHLGWKIEIVE